MADSEYMTVGEMAKRLNISRSLAYRMVENGEAPSVRFGTAIRIPVDKFEEWIRAAAAP